MNYSLKIPIEYYFIRNEIIRYCSYIHNIPTNSNIILSNVPYCTPPVSPPVYFNRVQNQMYFFIILFPILMGPTLL